MLIGAVVPHAPLLLLDGGDRDALPVARSVIREALTDVANGIRSAGAELCVIVSPHGTATGVHEGCSGSLRGFGLTGMEVRVPSDSETARALAEAWGFPLLHGEPDHGILVPLLLGLGDELPVVAVSLVDWTGEPAASSGKASVGDALRAAAGLAAAIRELAAAKKIAVIASAHLSAGSSPRAPLTEISGASDFDAELVLALGSDPDSLSRIEEYRWARFGCCGAGPLALFGALFAGRSARLNAFEAPVGVGYPVAVTT